MGLDYVISKIGKYWDDRSYTFDSEHDTENEEIWKSFILSILGDDKNKSVIDIGTGTGFLANMTAELGYNSIGMDISKGMMDYAVRHAREKGLNTVYMYGNAVALPLMDNSVDFVINARLLWTLVEPDTAIKEWKRVIKPGGKILNFIRMKENVGMTVYTPDFYNDREVDGSLKVNGAKIDELKSLMERNGLTDVEIIKLPDTAKNDEIKQKEWFEPWFVLCGTKPVSKTFEDEKSIAMFWNKSADTYEEGHQISDKEKWIKILTSFIGENRKISILDIATGTGIIANMLAETGYETVIGTDLSERMMNIAIKHAAEKGLCNVKYCYGNAMELPYEDETFDIVINSRLLWTLTEPEKAVKEWRRVLKKGGKVIAINELETGKGISYDNIGEYMRDINVDKLPDCPASVDEIKKDFIEAGFKNVDLVHMEGCRLAGSNIENWYAFIGNK